MSDIDLHISRLLDKPKSAILAKTSIKYLAQNIQRAIDNKKFFSLDYEKYGDVIIQQSDLSDEEKEKIRFKFQNKEDEDDDVQVPVQETKPTIKNKVKIITDTKEDVEDSKDKTEIKLRRKSEIISKFSHLEIPIGAPMNPTMKSQANIDTVKDDSMIAAMAADTSENQGTVQGIPVVRPVRRNSLMPKRPPSQIFVFE